MNIHGLKRRKLNIGESESDEDTDNPLRGYEDPIYPEKLTRPEICNCKTKVHVANHSTWMRMLKTKQQCPYNPKQVLTRRNLIKLTYDNFEMYKDKIDNLDF